MGRLFTTLFRLMTLVLFFAPIIITALAIQREPLVAANAYGRFDDISDAKDVMKRFDPRMMEAGRTTKVSVTDKEVAMAVGAALSRIDRIKGRVEATEEGVALQGTIELPIPDTFLGRYLNVDAVVAPSDTELAFSKLSIGAVPVPTFLIKPASIFMLDWFMGDGKGEPTYASIRSVAVKDGIITVAIQPPTNLVTDVKAAAGRALHLGNVEGVRAYYRKLQDVSDNRRKVLPVSLSSYMGPLFTLAEERSRTRDPVDENRALILALAMYFGDDRFELLLRDVKTADMRGDDFDTGEVKLERRHDWVQHFTTTAGIQVAAGSGISNFIGEAKEIKDSEGPSGFSFTDIAADRAGVRFAEIATSSTASALRLQRVLANGAAESDFFPKVADLPEGLSEGEFKAAYGDIDTADYRAMIGTIDRRIAKIELYK